MKRQAYEKPQFRNRLLQNNSPLHQATIQKTPDEELNAHTSAGTQFNHTFSQVKATAGVRLDGRSASMAFCPLFPQRCPFGGACHTCPPKLQAKLKVGQAGDNFEKEADRVADEVMRMPEPWDQRTCSAHGKNEMHQGKPRQTRFSRQTQRQVELEEQAKPIRTKQVGNPINDVDADIEAHIRSLRGSGQSLPESERNFFESRLGYDFSPVRVHTGDQAAEAAQNLKARAFTMGRDIVFGPGQYAPGTESGRCLLAHELTHTIQQRALATTVDKLDRPSISSVPSGNEMLNRSPDDEFEESELQDYLRLLTRTGDTEGRLNSDNKARAIVNAWRRGGSRYVLDARRKTLMIREMQEGFTGNPDEQAILEILERSYNFELSIIFGSSGIRVSRLNSDFHGTEWRRLQDFYRRRFVGGMAAMLSGTITPQGYPVPLGLDIEQAAGSVYDMSNVTAPMMELPGAEPSWNVPCVLGILCTRDRAVVSQLRNLTVESVERIEVTRWSFNGNWTFETVYPNGFNDWRTRYIAILTNRRPDDSIIDCDDAAEILIHEVRHQNQPTDWESSYRREMDAYTYDERWAIARGIPPSPYSSHRRTHPATGALAPDPTAIEQHVRRHYGGPTPGQRVIGHQPPATTVLRNPDNSEEWRPSEPGDAYNDPNTLRKINVTPIPASAWNCPQ